MTRIFSLALAVAAAVAIAAMGMGLMGAAAAQENASSTEANSAENSSAPAVNGTPVDEDVTLSDWSHTNGTFSLTFHHAGERPTTVTLSEATQPKKGAQQFSTRDDRLLPGSTTLTFSTRQADGGAVSITTAASKENGSGVKISTGRPDDDAEDPFAAFGGESGVFTGVGLSIMLAVVAAGWVLWREETGVIRA